MKRVRTAVIGCGAISDIYLQNLKNMFSVIDLVGCCDINIERCLFSANKHGIKSMTIEEILSDSSIELVVNLTNPKAHFPVTRQLLEGGKNVYTEKVLSVELEDAAKLVSIANEHNLYLGAAPDTFLGSAIQTARLAVERGMIGNVTSCVAQNGRDYNIMGQLLPFIPQHGGGIGFDVGIYYITALISILGSVKKVNGFLKYTNEPLVYDQPSNDCFGKEYNVESETILAGTLKFTNGTIGSVQFNSECIFPEQPIVMLCGTEGVIYMADPNNFGGTVFFRAKGSEERIVIPPAFGYSDNSRGIGVAEMAWSMINGRKPRANKEMAYHALEVLHGIAISNTTGKNYVLQSEFENMPLLKRGYFSKYLEKDNLVVDPEAALV
ncbi:MAG: Gfo/Idh/MocA family oxidoreductase [Christensenellaceae bacterium]|nr:Gfo/Idh/MocA family oxidoreductase [Christensenellaceae bacterium]